jgi:hypothetical protein
MVTMLLASTSKHAMMERMRTPFKPMNMSTERGQLVQRNTREGGVTYTREEEALRVDVTVVRL